MAILLAIVLSLVELSDSIVFSGISVSLKSETPVLTAIKSFETEIDVGGKLMFLENQNNVSSGYGGVVELIHYDLFKDCFRVIAKANYSDCHRRSSYVFRGCRRKTSFYSEDYSIELKLTDNKLFTIKNPVSSYSGIFYLKVGFSHSNFSDVFRTSIIIGNGKTDNDQDKSKPTSSRPEHDCHPYEYGNGNVPLDYYLMGMAGNDGAEDDGELYLFEDEIDGVVKVLTHSTTIRPQTTILTQTNTYTTANGAAENSTIDGKTGKIVSIVIPSILITLMTIAAIGTLASTALRRRLYACARRRIYRRNVEQPNSVVNYRAIGSHLPKKKSNNEETDAKLMKQLEEKLASISEE
ncbi:envelope glycoprotein I [Spheniscid alphaherpesvirus 1]|uniref:Envelope glycoprotein I n=1 Tax=Spheniscid alphaherpesvirus 1 TaxID=2560777 RepID=A0A1R3TAN3_9ALPH|nr:envelope glycoprotein I [Spheniscid alphaherpesvirus 1]